MKFFITSIVLFLVTSVTADAKQKNKDISVAKPIEEVVIKGRRPGPPLWRIENGENTFWVFGVVSTIPKSFEWDPSGIEHILSNSQQYFPLIERSVIVSIFNPIKAIGMSRKFNKLKKCQMIEPLRIIYLRKNTINF